MTADAHLRFYESEKLGPKRGMTPDGFLICRDVGLSRTGVQIYTADELALKGDAHGQVMIYRSPEEVFRPESIASANGAPVTLDHPPDGVLLNPENWKKFAVGEVQNPHRGEGLYEDLLVGDLLIKDKDAIRAVLDGGITEISLGYDCDYEQDMPGRGSQRNIQVNHAAILKDGRCGPRCRIQDHAAPGPARVEGERQMAQLTNDRAPRGRFGRFLDRALRAGKTDDSEEAERLKREAEEEDRRRDTDDRGDGGDKRTDDAHPDDRRTDDVHLHIHTGHPADDQDLIEARERELEHGNEPGADRRPRDARHGRDQGEGGEGMSLKELADQVAEIKEVLADLADAEEEEVGMMREEEENPEAETADRRAKVRDRRGALRDRIRRWRDARKRKTDDENIDPLPKDPDSAGIQPHGAGPGPDLVKGAEPAKLGTGDRRSTRDARMATRDSASLKTEFEATVAQAEILAPGIRMPTFDAAVPGNVTADRICALRRRALDAAYKRDDGHDAIETVLGGRTLNLKTATCDSIMPIFNAAAAVVAASNRDMLSGGRQMAVGVGVGANANMPSAVADFNKRNRERFTPPGWKN